MNQLEQIRIEKHKEFLRKSWLPQFFEKYKQLFLIKAQTRISRAIRKYLLPDVINMEALDYVPGLFRMRVKLSPENLVNPLDQKVGELANSDDDEDVDSDSDEHYKKKNKRYNKYKKYKMKEKEQNDNKFTDDLDKVIQESLKEYNNNVEDQIDTVINESMGIDYEEYILNQAILESLGKTSVDSCMKNNNNEPKENKKENIDYFHILIDIRDFHDNPEKPLLIDDTTYYLTEKQIIKLLTLWNRVNPNSAAGMKFHQDIDYHKSINKDNNK
ncbi:MAG: hypothetical protein Barrevirus7_19 [Barrevirus sp.]|uniref:Uncharacterized protein n=1 Tax=Barrevirus sp. TaxID=2487763 RepID=A0A3G4ZQ29_9VIRU|nr:MAG: hypothetical protein Barrevirus7_19 [Barrevirus sp.]